jgi:hypothetical protein
MRLTRHSHARNSAASMHPDKSATAPARTAARAGVAAAAAAATVSAVSLVGIVGIAAAPAGASRPASAQTEYLAAINAATDQGVHYVSKAKQGKVDFNVTGDTGVRSGTQTLTLKQGSTLEHMTVVAVGSTGYVNGNTTALKDVMGLSSATAKKYAGKWVSFDPSQQQYSELVAGLLNSQVADELKMSGPFHYGATKTVDGKQAIAIVGAVSDDSGDSVPSTLYVAASGPPFPIEQTTGASSKQTIAGSVSFTKWGEKVTQKAPAHATSVSKLAPASASSTTTTG